MSTRLPAPSLAHGSTTLALCCTMSHRRTLIVFNTSRMHWFDASLTWKFIVVRTCCYNSYIGSLSVSSNVLLQQLHWQPIRHYIDFKLVKLAFLAHSSATSLYLNSSVAPYLPSRTLRSQDTSLFAVLRTKTVFGSHVYWTCVIFFPRKSDWLTQFLFRFVAAVAFCRCFISAKPLINTSDITRSSDSTYFIDITSVKKLNNQLQLY